MKWFQGGPGGSSLGEFLASFTEASKGVGEDPDYK